MKKQLLSATLALALAFTLGCEEKKSAAKATDSTEPAAEAVAEPAKAEEAAKQVTPCKISEKVKLLVSFTDEKGKPKEKFEYDEQNRIVKKYTYNEGKLYYIESITYSGDDLVTVEKTQGNNRNVIKYVINGNTITVGEETLYVGTYQDGNFTESAYAYSYDDKKSPFSNTNTPKWLMQILLYNYSASKNNVLLIEGTEECEDVCPPTEFQYEYDSDGFPTKWTIISEEPPYEEQQKTIEYLTYSPFIDSRDGKKYGIINIGDQTWMSENLNFDAKGSKCYNNDQANCAIYGRLYNGETAKTACPKGWHLPSEAEWQSLVDFAGGKEIAGEKLKTKCGWNDNGDGTDNYGFSAMPGGNFSSDGNFDYIGFSGYWWCKRATSNSYYKYFRLLSYNSEEAGLDYANENFFFSIRCIKD